MLSNSKKDLGVEGGRTGTAQRVPNKENLENNAEKAGAGGKEAIEQINKEIEGMDVKDIDNRLSKLQDLLKFAKS